MRFALVDAMYPGEKPFLILDDPFVNLDDEKLARGRRLLAVLSQDYQVIYFTCHWKPRVILVEALFILDKYGSIFLFIEYNYMRVKISFDPHI